MRIDEFRYLGSNSQSNRQEEESANRVDMSSFLVSLFSSET